MLLNTHKTKQKILNTEDVETLNTYNTFYTPQKYSSNTVALSFPIERTSFTHTTPEARKTEDVDKVDSVSEEHAKDENTHLDVTLFYTRTLARTQKQENDITVREVKYVRCKDMKREGEG